MHNIVEGAAAIVEIIMPKKGSEKEQLVNSEVTSYASQPDISESKSNEETDPQTESGFFSKSNEPRHLSAFFGVIIPCILSMFSVIIFLRMGFIIGQAGLYQSLVILLLSYVIIGLTVLSVCAVSTNGAIEGGGAYFMISRALGPEFGGAIGLMFFLANVASVALYVFGIVEAMGDFFGPNGELVTAIPVSRWHDFGYASGILFICFVICLVGADIYAKATFIIFLVVMVSILSLIVSFFAKPAFEMTVNDSLPHRCNISSLYYTGLNSTTLHMNVDVIVSIMYPIPADYTTDYTTQTSQSFIIVFAVFFNGCIGINAGANMSGELKNPSKAIPKGTIIACLITCFIYLILMVFISATTPRLLLQCDYTFLVSINVWSPFVVIGIFASSISAVLSSLIGASRILLALAKDELFGIVLRPVTKTTPGGNPFAAVLATWLLVQLVLFAGKVNTIAPVVSVFFLFAYAAVDMSCLALEWASAPNFRPTFKYFSWHTCLAGMLSCLVMMFLISPIYASVSTVVLIALVIVIHYRVPTSSWGYVSQALIFHQVRKYLLMLDVRKEHVKFWRPQILLMVKNPRTCCQLIDFINSIKKSGLYVLGHVSPGKLSEMPRDLLQGQYHHWISLVEELGVKAFVELTLSNSIREGTEHLLRISGLGGMKPNTLVMGFYDDCSAADSFATVGIFKKTEAPAITITSQESTSAEHQNKQNTGNTSHNTAYNYFSLMSSADDAKNQKALQADEYIAIIADAIKMRKNICLGRYFHLLNKTSLITRKQVSSVAYVDVWPVNFLHPVLAKYRVQHQQEEAGQCPQSPSPFEIGTMGGIPSSTTSYFDVTSVFLMQMACILNMTPFWKRNTKLRINLCAESNSAHSEEIADQKLGDFLNTVRIKATVRTVAWEGASLLQTGKKSNDLEYGYIQRYSFRDFTLREAFIHARIDYTGGCRSGFQKVSDQSPGIQSADSNPSISVDEESGGHANPVFFNESQLLAGDEETVKDYLESVNSLIKSQISDTAVTFLYLPSPPTDESLYLEYLDMLSTISNDLGPTLFIHGLSHVVSTTL